MQNLIFHNIINHVRGWRALSPLRTNEKLTANDKRFFGSIEQFRRRSHCYFGRNHVHLFFFFADFYDGPAQVDGAIGVVLERVRHLTNRENCSRQRLHFVVSDALTDQPLDVLDFGRRKVNGTKRDLAVRYALQVAGHSQ